LSVDALTREETIELFQGPINRSNWLIKDFILMGEAPGTNETKEKTIEQLRVLQEIGIDRFFSLSNQVKKPKYQSLLSKVWNKKSMSFNTDTTFSTPPLSPSLSPSPKLSSPLHRTLSARSMSSLSSPTNRINLPKCSCHVISSADSIIPDAVLMDLRDSVLESLLLTEKPYIDSTGITLACVVLGSLYSLNGKETINRVQSYYSTRNGEVTSFTLFSQEQIDQIVRICDGNAL
jgi:hypothetical protein